MGHHYIGMLNLNGQIDSKNVNKQKTASFGSRKRTARRCPSWQRVV